MTALDALALVAAGIAVMVLCFVVADVLHVRAQRKLPDYDPDMEMTEFERRGLTAEGFIEHLKQKDQNDA